MAFSVATVGQLNTISIVFAVLYIGLGIDYVIHFVLKFNELILSGNSFRETLHRTFRDLAPALMLSAFSTAFAFYAFVPTFFAGVSELGLIAGTGMFSSLMVTFTLLHSLLKLLYKSAEQSDRIPLTAPFARYWFPVLNKYSSLIKTLGILAGIGSLLLLPQIRFDYNPVNLRDPETESVRTINDLTDSGSFAPWAIEIMVADSSEAMQLAGQISQLEAVDRALTLFSFIPKIRIKNCRLSDG